MLSVSTEAERWSTATAIKRTVRRQRKPLSDAGEAYPADRVYTEGPRLRWMDSDGPAYATRGPSQHGGEDGRRAESVVFCVSMMGSTMGLARASEPDR